MFWRVFYCVAAGLAMLIAQGTTQMTAGAGGGEMLAIANNRSPITVEANTTLSGGPSELTALTSTT